MTVAPLSTTTPSGAGWLDAAEAALLNAIDPQALSGEQARAEVRRMGRFDAMQAARKMALLRRIEETEVAKNTGATSTGSLISGDFGGDQASCSRQVRAAKNLKVATLTEKALREAQISFDKAEVIAKTMAALPQSLDDVTRVRVEKRLIADAIRLALPDLRRRVLRVADLYMPKAEADVDEDTQLRRQEAAAWQATEFWMGQSKNGLVRFGGQLPALQADLLKNQLGAIAAPRRRGFEGGSAATSTTADGDEELTHAQRMGRALCSWIEKIPTDALPTTGGTPATLTVNLDYDALTQSVREAAGMLATGTRISASEVRRLACTHQILPRVLDGASQILDQGRTKRVFTPAQRLALADRDGGCTYPGCDRPPAWTEAHHLDWFERDGGATDLERGTLLCARHHHWVHSEDIHIRRRHGHTEFQLKGVWERNHRWRP